ncbi:MAG: hypothetical protein ACC619_02615 [Paracoccaceae bacterium]
MSTGKILTAAILALTLGAPMANAKAHGNDLVHSRKLGGVVFMMNEVHMSLYTYDNDTPGVSNCYGECATAWPPALLAGDAKLGRNYTLVERTDGTFQAAYLGRPLYLWAGDKKIGDIKGDGVGGVWRLARPEN